MVVEDQQQCSTYGRRSREACDGRPRLATGRNRYRYKNTIHSSDHGKPRSILPESSCRHRKKRVWEVPPGCEIDPQSPEIIYYLQPPGCYTLQVVVCMENVIKAIEAEKLAAINGTPQEDVSTSAEHKTSPTSLEVFDRHTIKVGAQADGRNGFTIPARFFLGRTYQVLEGVPPQARKWFSRRHCCVCWRYEGLRLGEATFTLIDLGSANGTYLNGKVLPPAGSHSLHSGDLIGVSMTESGEPMLAFRFVVHSIASRVRGLDPTPQRCLSEFSGASDDHSSTTSAPSTPAMIDCHCLDCRLERASYTSFVAPVPQLSSTHPCPSMLVDTFHTMGPHKADRMTNSYAKTPNSASQTSSTITPLFPASMDASNLLVGKTRKSQGSLSSFTSTRNASNAAETFSLLRRRNSVTESTTQRLLDRHQQLVHDRNGADPMGHPQRHSISRLNSERKEIKHTEDDTVLQPLKKQLSERRLGFVDVPTHREAIPSSIFAPQRNIGANMNPLAPTNSNFSQEKRGSYNSPGDLFFHSADSDTMGNEEVCDSDDEDDDVAPFSSLANSRRLNGKHVCKPKLHRRGRQRETKLLRGPIDYSVNNDGHQRTDTPSLMPSRLVRLRSSRSSRRAQRHLPARRPRTARRRRADSLTQPADDEVLSNSSKRTGFFSKKKRRALLLNSEKRRNNAEGTKKKKLNGKSLRFGDCEGTRQLASIEPSRADARPSLEPSDGQRGTAMPLEQGDPLTNGVGENVWKSPLRGSWATFRSSVVAREGVGWRSLFDKKTKEQADETLVPGTMNNSEEQHSEEQHAVVVEQTVPNVIQSCIVRPSSQETSLDSYNQSLEVGVDTFAREGQNRSPTSSLGRSSIRMSTIEIPMYESSSPPSALAALETPTISNSYHNFTTLKSESATNVTTSSGGHFLHGVVRRLGTHISRRRRSLPGVSDIPC